jgi:hypothetical protein
MERLDPEVNNPIAQATLFEQAVGLTAVPQAYLCCALQREQVRIYCLHLPSRYMAVMDGQATPWDDKEYAFLGDITQGVIAMVEFPANAFQVVGNVRAKTSDYILTNLPLLGNKGLQHIAVNDPEATFVDPPSCLFALSICTFIHESCGIHLARSLGTTISCPCSNE